MRFTYFKENRERKNREILILTINREKKIFCVTLLLDISRHHFSLLLNDANSIADKITFPFLFYKFQEMFAKKMQFHYGNHI